MLKPSKRHFLRYDAQTYETQGFIDLCGIPLKMHNDTTKDQRFSKEPRFWYVTATAITQNEDATEKRKTHFKFTTDQKTTLGELSIVVNDHINKDNDFLPDCVSVMDKVRVVKYLPELQKLRFAFIRTMAFNILVSRGMVPNKNTR